jgi:hypothetical protein
MDFRYTKKDTVNSKKIKLDNQSFVDLSSTLLFTNFGIGSITQLTL